MFLLICIGASCDTVSLTLAESLSGFLGTSVSGKESGVVSVDGGITLGVVLAEINAGVVSSATTDGWVRQLMAG